MKASSIYLRHFFTVLLGVLLVLGGFNWVVDPFERNQRFDLGLPKQTVSSLMNYQMYKILKFEKDPQPVIVLGDSRSDALRAEYFADAGQTDVFNFAYGGGTLYEAIDTFWFATEKVELKRVILGIPFCIYTENNSLNRFPTAREVTKNPLSYYLSPLVSKASAMNLLTRLTGHRFVSEEPPMAADEFWQHQLGPGTDMYYAMWGRPKVLRERLDKMAEYCRQEGIELVFWIPPTHTDLQDRLADYGLEDEYQLYKTDLAQLGTVMDYDQPSELTRNSQNFLDPYHFTEKIARQLVDDVVRSAR